MAKLTKLIFILIIFLVCVTLAQANNNNDNEANSFTNKYLDTMLRKVEDEATFYKVYDIESKQTNWKKWQNIRDATFNFSGLYLYHAFSNGMSIYGSAIGEDWLVKLNNESVSLYKNNQLLYSSNTNLNIKFGVSSESRATIDSKFIPTFSSENKSIFGFLRHCGECSDIQCSKNGKTYSSSGVIFFNYNKQNYFGCAFIDK